MLDVVKKLSTNHKYMIESECSNKLSYTIENYYFNLLLSKRFEN